MKLMTGQYTSILLLLELSYVTAWVLAFLIGSALRLSSTFKQTTAKSRRTFIECVSHPEEEEEI